MIYDLCVRGVLQHTAYYYYTAGLHGNIIVYKQLNVFSKHVWTLYANWDYYKSVSYSLHFGRYD